MYNRNEPGQTRTRAILQKEEITSAEVEQWLESIMTYFSFMNISVKSIEEIPLIFDGFKNSLQRRSGQYSEDVVGAMDPVPA